MRIEAKECAWVWRNTTDKVLLVSGIFEHKNDGAMFFEVEKDEDTIRLEIHISFDFIKAHPEAFRIIEDEPTIDWEKVYQTRIEVLEKENERLGEDSIPVSKHIKILTSKNVDLEKDLKLSKSDIANLKLKKDGAIKLTNEYAALTACWKAKAEGVKAKNIELKTSKSAIIRQAQKWKQLYTEMYDIGKRLAKANDNMLSVAEYQAARIVFLEDGVNNIADERDCLKRMNKKLIERDAGK